MSGWLRWVGGRQHSGYEKLLLLRSKRLRCDCYVLRYRPAAFIAEHTDPVDAGFEHRRINIELWRGVGGTFLLQGVPQHARIHSFRPDVQPHAVTPVERGTRYVLSIGWRRRAAPHFNLAPRP